MWPSDSTHTHTHTDGVKDEGLQVFYIFEDMTSPTSQTVGNLPTKQGWLGGGRAVTSPRCVCVCVCVGGGGAMQMSRERPTPSLAPGGCLLAPCVRVCARCVARYKKERQARR